MVCSPQYGGKCDTIFARSYGDLQQLAGRFGIALDALFLMSESLITRARNVCAQCFLNSSSNHLMFIDADIGFEAVDVLALLFLQIRNLDYEIIGGRYRKKTLGGGWVFNSTTPVDDALSEPQEVDGIGTGFMMIDRGAFAKFDKAFPQFKYTPDYGPDLRGAESLFKGDEEMMQYFQAEIDPVSKRYLSEDYWFSKRCQEIGVRTWLCPWIKLRHAGIHIYE